MSTETKPAKWMLKAASDYFGGDQHGSQRVLAAIIAKHAPDTLNFRTIIAAKDETIAAIKESRSEAIEALRVARPWLDEHNCCDELKVCNQVDAVLARAEKK